MHNIYGEISGPKLTVFTDSTKVWPLDNEVQTLKHRIGILSVVNAKQHIIIGQLYDQQNDLMNCNMSINILFHNIPENPMENVRPRQNPDGLWDDPITTRLIINMFPLEVMGIDSKVVHDIPLNAFNRFYKTVEGKHCCIIVKFCAKC